MVTERAEEGDMECGEGLSILIRMVGKGLSEEMTSKQ